MTGVVIPDGSKWRFDYDTSVYSLGNLMAVTTPTGAQISYTWSISSYGSYSWESKVATRTIFDGTNSNKWTYAFIPNGNTATVTDPLGNDTVYTQLGLGENLGVISQIKYYSGSSTGSGTWLKTVANSYRDLPNPFTADINQSAPDPQLLTGTVMTWADGHQSQDALTYDSGFTFYDDNYGPPIYYASVYGLVTARSHSDYGNGSPGPVIATTNTTYKYSSDSRYLAANILDLPASVIVTDGNPTPNVCAETDYGYDEYALDPSGVTVQHVAAPNSVQGNLTSVTRQLFTNPCAPPTPTKTPLKTTYHVFDTGMRHTSTDSRMNTTTYAYSPTFYGAYVTQTTMPITSSPSSANHIVSGNYDFNTGLLTSFTDQNSNVTNYTYDVMLRPTNVTYASPDGGQTNFYYANTTTVEMQKLIAGTTWTDSFVYYDGLGRARGHRMRDV